MKCFVTLAPSLVLLAAGEPREAEGCGITPKDTHLRRVFGLQVDFQGCRFSWSRSSYSRNDNTDTGGVVPAPVGMHACLEQVELMCHTNLLLTLGHKPRRCRASPT